MRDRFSFYIFLIVKKVFFKTHDKDKSKNHEKKILDRNQNTSSGEIFVEINSTLRETFYKKIYCHEFFTTIM